MTQTAEIKTIEYPNAIVRVHIPYLSDEDHVRQMRRVKKAAEALLKSQRKEGA